MSLITIDSDSLCSCACGKQRVTRPRSPMQTSILRFIEQYIHREACAPKLVEICQAVGRSKPVVHKHIREMSELGLLSFQRHRSRSIVLAEGLELGSKPGDNN